MKQFIDVGYESANKYGEELCGDRVEIINAEDGIIVVLSDGLGSGVKANILGGLTSKIAGTMLKEGATIFETVDTIINTLPICKVRGIAYSTFTILKVHNDGKVYAAEYENPPCFVFQKRNSKIQKKELNINGRIVKESNFNLEPGDTIVVASDGIIHAGIDNVLNLGWQWEHVHEYLKDMVCSQKCSKGITKKLIETCMDLYNNKPGDDATVVTIKFRNAEVVDLFAGPPVNREMDNWIVKKLLDSHGKKVVCGGTAANIVARETKRAIRVSMNYLDADVPPTAEISGIDLVTEGVLTLIKVLEKLKNYKCNCSRGNTGKDDFSGEDGASKLSSILLNDCTHLNLWVGKAMNPAHQNPDLPIDLSIKIKVVKEIAEVMKSLGKKVELTYI